jgi:hypothetical protein
MVVQGSDSGMSRTAAAPPQPDISLYLGLAADAQEYADLLVSVYDSEDALQTILNVAHDEVDSEALRRGRQQSGSWSPLGDAGCSSSSSPSSSLGVCMGSTAREPEHDADAH